MTEIPLLSNRIFNILKNKIMIVIYKNQIKSFTKLSVKFVDFFSQHKDLRNFR